MNKVFKPNWLPQGIPRLVLPTNGYINGYNSRVGHWNNIDKYDPKKGILLAAAFMIISAYNIN